MNINLKEMNSSHYIATGLDGRGASDTSIRGYV